MSWYPGWIDKERLMIRRPILLAAAVILTALSQSGVGAQAPAAGDPVKGQAVFDGDCGTCHTAAKVSTDSSTLSLFGVVGRKAGANADFSYSPAMQAAGFVWTPAKLDAYITDPAAVVPGNIMYFSGVSDPTQRADLIAYLSTLK
jgi:cytochrome c